MPFVSMSGSERIRHDIRREKRDPVSFDITQPGNNLEPLLITGVDGFDFELNGDSYKELIRRGQPNSTAKNWYDTPVFKVPTNRFKSGFEWIENKTERELTDWGRFMRDYIGQKYSKSGAIFFYEPDIEDVRVDTATNFHFPMWVLDILIKEGEFEQAKTVNKVMLPGVPRLTKQEYERIMEEIKARKANEEGKQLVGNVSGNSKSGSKSAS